MENNRARSSVPRTYEDFQPSTEWISDEASQTLLIRLPGFSKEHLKVQMDNFGNLRAIGERPLEAGGRRWSRFQTEQPIPQSCDVRGVRARFDDSVLYITLPKLITEEPKPSVPQAPTPKPIAPPAPTPMPEPEPMPELEKKPPVPEPEPMPELEKKPPVPEQKQETESKRKDDEEVKEKEKEKEEKEQRDVDNDWKEKTGGVAAVAPPPEKTGIQFLEGIRRPRQLVVNMFVALIVIVVIGIYVGYKMRRGAWGAWGPIEE